MSLRVWLPLNGNLNNQGLDNITVTNSGATVNTAGKIGSCYSFDGSDDYIALTGTAFYNTIKGGSNPFSIAFWIYHADSTRAIVFGDYSLSGAINFNIELTTAHALRFYWGGSPDKNFSSDSSVGASTWTHIVITYDGSQVLLYKNGSVITDKYTGTLASKTKTSGAFYLGRDSRTGTTAFNGRLNDFRLYDHCLSPKEVKEISQGLVLHYPLSEAPTGTTVYDCSGYGHNGTSSGSITTNSSTGRYDNSLKYPDSACAIGIGNLSTIVPEGIFTFNVWFKKVTGEWSSKSWETILGGPSGFELEGKLSSSQNAYVHPYNWGGGSTSTPNSYSMAYDLDKWNMVTMVRNDTGTKFYINGEFKVNGSTRGSIPSGDYFIGAWKTATQQNYRGYFSDARIYATALSDVDIKELYDTAASIDNGGNMHGYEFVENSTTSNYKIEKTGLIYADNLIEINDKIKVLNDGSVWFQVLRHNNPASNLFTVNNCWLNNTTDLYSALLLLKDASWFTSQSPYEFLICEKLTSSSTEKQYRWTQTSNPATSSTLSGYTVISGSPARSCGLMNKGTYAAMHNGGTWWVACGSYTAFNGGIPGVENAITSGYLELYVRIPADMLKGTIGDNLKIFNKSMLGKQMIEW